MNAPTGPDTSASVYGYDNGGFFGPAFANLGGAPFTITWTGTDCNCYGGPIMGAPNVISGATLTINGITIDLAAFNNIWQSEWLDHADGSNTFIQMETTFQSLPFPPWSQILPSSQYSLTTEFAMFHGIPSGDGVFYLQDSNHSFQTSAFLTMGVGLGVPAPIVGTGPAAILLAASLLCLVRRFSH